MANDEMVPHVVQFRETLEISAAELALENTTTQQHNILRDIANDMAHHAEHGAFNDFIDADYRFHLTLCELSQNKLYEVVYA